MSELSRDVNLLAYLPKFMQDYAEIEATLNAEDPEFTLVWEGVNRVLINLFISTADEYGISQFEDLLDILPSKSDTLESRRSKVQALWWNSLPYTVRALAAKLAEICGDDGYELDTSQLTEYAISIVVHLYQYGEIDTLREVVYGMIPATMIVDITNEIVSVLEDAIAAVGTVVVVHQALTMTNDVEDENDTYIPLNALVGSIGEFTDEATEGNVGRDLDEELAVNAVEGTAAGVHHEYTLMDTVEADYELESDTAYTGTTASAHIAVTLQDFVIAEEALDTDTAYIGIAMAVHIAATLQDVVITEEALDTDTAYAGIALASAFSQAMDEVTE